MAIRLDMTDEEAQFQSFKDMMLQFDEHITFAFIVREVAKKTSKIHLQGCIELDKSQKENMRIHLIRKIYKGKAPKGIYSFAIVKDYQAYMEYLSKGEEEGTLPCVVYWKGITQQQVDAFREGAVKTQQEYLKKQSDIKKKHKVLTGAIKCINYLEEHKSSFIDDEGYLDQGKMAHIIISFFRNTSVVHDRIIFRKFYNLANNHFNPKGHTWDMLHDLRHEITLSKVLVSTGHPEYHSGHLHIRHADDGHFDELEKELISNEVLNNDE